MTNCATGALQAFTPSAATPWNRVRAGHLHRRAGFGATVTTILADLDRPPTAVVDEMIDRAKALPLSPEPGFAFKPRSEYGLALLESTLEKDGWARQWLIDLQLNGLRGRMAFFWHNHFVTRFDVYQSASYTYQYHRLLQEYAVGNFKDFVRAIGLTPAMLMFLNGAQNELGLPNENYARELYELFTLGDNNGYTQNDIEETARALTGYTNITETWGPIVFDANKHDDGVKTIFSRTGNWGYDDVIDILFEQRAPQIAEFIAGKLYRNFVNPIVNEDFVAELAAVLLAEEWDIAETLRALFSSEHFFDARNFSTIIAGPVEHQLILRTELNSRLNGLTVFTDYGGANEQGQAIFNPVDVAGWPGNRSWINTTSIRSRWEYQASLIGQGSIFNFAYYKELVLGATDEPLDVDVICRDLIHYFMPQGLQYEEDYAAALISFKGEIPENYFQNGIWTVNYWATPFQLSGLLNFLGRLPEFQLR